MLFRRTRTTVGWKQDCQPGGQRPLMILEHHGYVHVPGKHRGGIYPGIKLGLWSARRVPRGAVRHGLDYRASGIPVYTSSISRGD
jgi:hypothetical protein